MDNGSNVVKAFKECLIALTVIRHNESDVLGAATASAAIQPSEFLDANLDSSFIESEDTDMVNDLQEFNENENVANIYFERQKRMSCFAHNLMLAVRAVIDEDDGVKSVKEEALSLITSVCGSPKAVETLHQKCGLGLIKPVKTRWIYWYFTFERLLRIKKVVCEVCEELKILHEIGLVKWKTLEAITELLQPFAKAVTKLEGENYVTISEVYPMLYSLIKKLEAQQPQNYAGVIHILSKKLISELKEHFSKVINPRSDGFDPIFGVSMLLDPRFALLLEGELLRAAEEELERMVATYGSTAVYSSMVGRSTLCSIDTSDDLLAIATAKVEERCQLHPQSTPPQNSITNLKCT